ncbi:MAG TPA: MauE/DoxX family redox-associated membrane protein [Gemmataceae bacterium]|nr:MauE/DoxX family redox-associated membrane protein [Gemmataceae bacterium]
MVLGLFLLSAAGLKIHGLFFDPSAHESILTSPRIQVATIEIELLLGGWLLSGWWVRAAWAAVLVFFGILASASLYLALVGQTTCGCFGRVAVPPWATVAMDVAVLAALLLCRPRTSHAPQAAWALRCWSAA